ncbi:MAG: hypothetical protein NZT92_11140 [Abditibacteriales bacterium]|nr:hypothetical protein [Abditibacteriales bacterium]MDW8366456.1 hypothetical protein [Abditibacteriales bacterium]
MVLLAGDLRLSVAQRDALRTFVQNGGALLGIGGTSGLDDVFGVSGTRPLWEGWMKPTGEHPITVGLRSSLHVFGGNAVTTANGTSLASIESGRQGVTGSAIVENRFGAGRAVLLAPDLLFSIVHIQQGLPVLSDGKPSPDGSAPLNDGMLKAEDGLVLDWERDRTPMDADGTPTFLEPISDELRAIVLRSVFYLAREQGIPLPMLWYYPRDLKALGHISHDTDGNSPEQAWALLDVVNDCGIKSTWCTLYPGGYPPEFYRALKEQAFEIALHYDAMSGGRETSWSKQNLLFQHRWLRKEAGIAHITSNKNHYTRWEGRLDFLRWCEAAGINVDQTRGPSKKGDIGFPLGGAQPYFPLDDERERPRFLHVLEINMLTQDLVITCPPDYGRQLLDAAARHYGVAHFLFHPAHVLKEGVADAIRHLVAYGREQGVEWWTSEQIYQWEMLRRGVQATFDADGTLTLRAPRTVPDATLLFLRPQRKRLTVRVDGRAVRGQRWRVYGFDFDQVTLDIGSKVELRIQ